MYNCGIKELVIPKGVEFIENRVFNSCEKLKTVTVSEGVKEFGSRFIYECENLRTINYNAMNAINTSKEFWIEDCTNDLELNIGENVKSIPSRFMYNCGIKELVIPKWVEVIGNNAFVSCEKIETVTVSEGVKEFGSRFIYECENLRTINYNAINAINTSEEFWIEDCTNDLELNIGENVKVIPSGFMYNCGIKELVIPKGVEFIENRVFNSCEKLKTVTVSEGVKEFGSRFICECENLRTINYNAINATNVTSGKPAIIYGCTNDLELNIGENVKSIPSDFMYNCGIKELVIPEGVEVIGIRVFRSNEKLETVTVSEGVKEFGYRFIHECKNLRTINYNAINAINVSGSLWMIEDCTNEVVLNIGEKVRAIPNGFIKNSIIKNVVFPENVEKINYDSIKQCNEIINITIYNPSCEILNEFGDNLKLVIINGFKNSTAESYAKEKNYEFNAIGCVHEYETVIKEATCREDGYEKTQCVHCENVLNNEIINAFGHVEEIDIAVDATCSTSGLTEGSHCLVCKEVVKQQKEIPILQHTWDTGKIIAQATCVNEGKVVYTCTVCNVTKVKRLDVESHNIVVDEGVKPSCTKTGMTVGKHCAKCEMVLEKQETIKASGHSYKNIIVKPTYITKGYTLHICTICGKKYKSDYIGKIKLKRTKISRIYTKNRKIIVRWEMNKNGMGYQIQYSKDRFFAKKKSIKIRKSGKTKISIKKKKKRCYFRVRVYKRMKGKTVYSLWSKTKSIK